MGVLKRLKFAAKSEAFNAQQDSLIEETIDADLAVLARWQPSLPALAHGQVGCAVQPVHALVVHAGKAGTQQIVGASVAKASAYVSDLDDAGLKVLGHGVNLGWVAVAVAGEPRKPAHTSLGQIALLDHHDNGCAPGLRG